MAFLRKVILMNMMIFLWWFVFAQSKPGQTQEVTQPSSTVCSTMKRSPVSTTLWDLFWSDPFLWSYLNKTSSISGNTTIQWWHPSWFNNDLDKKESGCQNNNSDWWWLNAESQWFNSFVSSNSSIIKNYFSNYSVPNGGQVAQDKLRQIQSYITWVCGISLKRDGKLWIKTLNAIAYCKPPVWWKLSRNDFASLTNAWALFSDDKWNDLIYDSWKTTFSSNFNEQNIYVDISNPTAKTKWITDQASADVKWLKIVDKTGLSNNACFKKLWISYFVASWDVNSIWDNCCYNKDTESQWWKISDDIATYSTIPVFWSSSFDISIPICKSSCRFASPEKWSDNEKIYLEALNNSWFVKWSCDTWCPPNHVEVMKWWSMLCEKCDMKKCNCGIKLNTNIPFIGRCIMNKQTNNVWQSGDVMTVNSLNAFPILMWALIKLLMSIIMIVCFASLIVWGFMMTVPDQYDTWKWIIKKVVWTIVALWSLWTILYLINPNFFA